MRLVFKFSAIPLLQLKCLWAFCCKREKRSPFSFRWFLWPDVFFGVRPSELGLRLPKHLLGVECQVHPDGGFSWELKSMPS